MILLPISLGESLDMLASSQSLRMQKLICRFTSTKDCIPMEPEYMRKKQSKPSTNDRMASPTKTGGLWVGTLFPSRLILLAVLFFL